MTDITITETTTPHPTPRYKTLDEMRADAKALIDALQRDDETAWDFFVEKIEHGSLYRSYEIALVTLFALDVARGRGVEHTFKNMIEQMADCIA